MRSHQEQDRQGTNARRARRKPSISVESLEGRLLLWPGMGTMPPMAPTPVMQVSMPTSTMGATTGSASPTSSGTVTMTTNSGGSSSGGGGTFSLLARFRTFHEVIMPSTNRGTAATNPTRTVTPANNSTVSTPKHSSPAPAPRPMPAPAPAPVSALAAVAHHGNPHPQPPAGGGHHGHLKR
jgi:hypothetical protein